MSRLTFDPADDARPVWSPDGSRIAFASKRGDKVTFNVYWQRADGTGDVQRLTDSKSNQMPTSFHPSGKFLAFSDTAPMGFRVVYFDTTRDLNMVDPNIFYANKDAVNQSVPNPFYNILTVDNRTSDDWTHVEIWLNTYFRITVASIPATSRFQVPCVR